MKNKKTKNNSKSKQSLQEGKKIVFQFCIRGIEKRNSPRFLLQLMIPLESPREGNHFRQHNRNLPSSAPRSLLLADYLGNRHRGTLRRVLHSQDSRRPTIPVKKTGRETGWGGASAAAGSGYAVVSGG